MIQQGLIASYQESTPAVTYATWNPSDKSSLIILSNGNLTASQASPGFWGSVRSTVGKSSGKWYWEFTTTNASAGSWINGIGNALATLDVYPGFDTNGWGVRFYDYGGGTGDKVNGNSFSAFMPPGQVYTTDVYGMALDMDNGTLKVYINNVLIGTAFSGLSGTVYAQIGINQQTNTFNFGATPMAYTAPAGYNQGLYESTSDSVSVLVVAGGGAGGGDRGGGGGGGGVVYDSAFTVTPQAYSITVGAGGVGQGAGVSPNSGQNSVFSTITAIGGGGGGGTGGGPFDAKNGGCGGGGHAYPFLGGILTGGTGSQGYNGGDGFYGGDPQYNNGGGGGAGSIGISATSSTAGNGGDGVVYSISGSAVTYAGGGGGSGDSRIFPTVGTGGTGGGGDGGSSGANGNDGTANTGGGGGGASGPFSGTVGGNGGSGIVIIAYTTGSISATGGTITTSGGNTIHTFTGDGTFTVS